MDERTETRVMFLVATALALFGVFAPYHWHDMPSWLTNSALVLALFLAIWAGLIWMPSPAKGLKKSMAAFLIASGACALIVGVVLYLDQTPQAKIGSLHSLTNLELRNAAMEFAAKLRMFDANANEAIRQATNVPPNTPPNEISQRLLQVFNQRQLEFSNVYLANARNFREEIAGRLKAAGIFTPYRPENARTTFLEYQANLQLDEGVLKGANSVTVTADYLEITARLLPGT